MSFQNTATDILAIGYEGDRVGLINTSYGTLSMQVTNNALRVGQFAWKVLNTEANCDGVKGSNTLLAGYTQRSQTTTNTLQGISVNASMTIPTGQIAELAVRGQFLGKIISLAGTNPVLQGSAVYADDNGNIVADAGGVLTSYTKTNFLFDSPSAELIVGGLVKISNSQNVVA